MRKRCDQKRELTIPNSSCVKHDLRDIKGAKRAISQSCHFSARALAQSARNAAEIAALNHLHRESDSVGGKGYRLIKPIHTVRGDEHALYENAMDP
jgi:hypothetical protein